MWIPRCNPLPRAHPCDARWTLATPSHMLEDLALACGIDLPSFSILTPAGSCGKAEGGGESKEAITRVGRALVSALQPSWLGGGGCSEHRGFPLADSNSELDSPN